MMRGRQFTPLALICVIYALLTLLIMSEGAMLSPEIAPSPHLHKHMHSPAPAPSPHLHKLMHSPAPAPSPHVHKHMHSPAPAPSPHLHKQIHSSAPAPSASKTSAGDPGAVCRDVVTLFSLLVAVLPLFL